VIWRYYAIIVTADRRDLNELLVSKGLGESTGHEQHCQMAEIHANIFRIWHALENEAKAAKRGGWGKVNL